MNKEQENIILVIGSSMTMPRLEVPFKNTWLYYLMNYLENFVVLDKSRRASTSKRLVSDGAGYKDVRRGADLLEYYEPRIVITQIGITDCAPRLLDKNKLSTKLLNVSPIFFKNMIYNYLKKNKKRKIENADVSIEEFEQNWVSYINRAKTMKTDILCILISAPTTLLRNKNPNSEIAINMYNNVLMSLSEIHNNFHVLIPFTQEEIDNFAIDEFHVSSEGHKNLFQKIKIKISELIDGK